MKRHRKKDRKNYIIAFIFLIIVFMTAGYAAYTRDLVINATGKVLTDWNVQFTNVLLNHQESTLLDDNLGGGTEEAEPVIADDGLSMTVDISLIYTSDRVSYDIDITNFSEMFDAEYVGSIISTDNTNDFILYEIDGIDIGDKILKDTSSGVTPNFKTISLTAFWNQSKTMDIPEDNPHEETATITLQFEASE